MRFSKVLAKEDVQEEAVCLPEELVVDKLANVFISANIWRCSVV
jgi:hypothetical protein